MPERAVRMTMVAALALLAACSGVAVRPDAVRATDLRVATLDAEESARLQQHIDRAIADVMQRRYDEAERAARAALGLDPRAARARAVLGLTTLQQASKSDPPDHRLGQAAEAELRLAEQLQPDDAFVGWMHAVFLAESGHMSAAAATAERALEQAAAAPANERAALLGIAGTYRYELGEERAARPHLEAYLGLRPDDAAAWFRLGSSLLRIAAVPRSTTESGLLQAQLDAEAAARAFERSVALAPGDDDAAIAAATALLRAAELAKQRGDVAVAQRHGDAAAARLRAVAEQFPANAESWFGLGVLAERQGASAEAIAAYEQALARDAGHTGSLLNLAALRAASNPEAAKLLWRRLLAADAEQRVLSPGERRRLQRLVAAN